MEIVTDRLSKAAEIAAFTGAGMSAESGVTTFRSNDGLWAKFKPEELASMSAFIKNPRLVRGWYEERRKIVAAAKPNAGHYALAEMERDFRLQTVITQNIDNLHRRAGSEAVCELHGNIEQNYCMDCGMRYDGSNFAVIDETQRCTQPGCTELVRPDVVWFGELLPEDEWNSAVKAAERADVVLSIGTSGVVFPAASIPQIARKQGAYVVEINPEATCLSQTADAFLQGHSGEILPRLLEGLRHQRQQSSIR